RLERLLRFARLLDLPVITTVERPVGEKGGLPERLVAELPRGPLSFEKSTFDCMAEEPIRTAIAKLGRKRIAVAGAETDVCVLFSVLALRAAGYEVFLLEDCLFSSTPVVGAALARMRSAGATPATLKTFCYELTGTVQAAWPDEWRQRLAEQPELFPPPEDLPPRA
ncbi:MAG: isochorismatase family protein, partial [Planctomycetota bacterium]